jgi:hypothetical protein
MSKVFQKKEMEDEERITQNQALPIKIDVNYKPGNVFKFIQTLLDFSKPPQDAEEYLRRVHFEASTLKQTITSQKEFINQTEGFDNEIEFFEKPNGLFQVNKSWSEDVVKEFKNLNEV